MLEEDISRIAKIPLSLQGGKDKLFWVFSSTGLYTVKSGYPLAKECSNLRRPKRDQEGATSRNKEEDDGWKVLWNLNMKHKLKHFIWKALLNILPVNEVLYNKIGKGDPVCSCCGEEMETTEHMLFRCQNAQRIWRFAPIRWDGLEHLRHNFWLWWKELMEVTTRVDGKEHITLTINIMWQVWKVRNDWIFNKKRRIERQILNKAVEDWLEYKEGATKNVTVKEQTVTRDQWQLPGEESIKINTDAAINQAGNKAAGGIVARKATSELLRCWALPKSVCTDPALEEALVIRTALLKAKEEKWRKIIIQSDCKSVIDKINGRQTDDVRLGVVLSDICVARDLFEECFFSFVGRERNSVSHNLAKLAIDLKSDIYWKDSFPLWLEKLVQDDVRAVAHQCNSY